MAYAIRIGWRWVVPGTFFVAGVVFGIVVPRWSDPNFACSAYSLKRRIGRFQLLTISVFQIVVKIASSGNRDFGSLALKSSTLR